MRLEGKIAAVTGGGSGMGKAISQAYAREGARVIVADLNLDAARGVAEQITAGGGEAIPVQTDVRDQAQAQAMIDAAVATYGGLDVLVNNAGVGKIVPFLETTNEDWDFMFDVNCKGLLWCSQAAARVMIARQRGKVLHIASMTSYRGFDGISLYGLTKTAVLSLTRTMAVEWAPHNIQVNAIAPGWIDTPMTATMTPERRRWVEEHVPQGKYGTPDDIAPLAVYLASAAADYVTGQTFPVDGGFLAGNPWAALKRDA